MYSLKYTYVQQKQKTLPNPLLSKDKSAQGVYYFVPWKCDECENLNVTYFVFYYEKVDLSAKLFVNVSVNKSLIDDAMKCSGMGRDKIERERERGRGVLCVHLVPLISSPCL